MLMKHSRINSIFSAITLCLILIPISFAQSEIDVDVMFTGDTTETINDIVCDSNEYDRERSSAEYSVKHVTLGRKLQKFNSVLAGNIDNYPDKFYAFGYEPATVWNAWTAWIASAPNETQIVGDVSSWITNIMPERSNSPHSYNVLGIPVTIVPDRLVCSRKVADSLEEFVESG